MKNLLAIVGLGAVLLATPTLAATTDAECEAAWKKADVNGDGTVTEAEAARYFAAMRLVNKPLTDGKMTRAIFMENCRADYLVVNRHTDPGAPLKGANSFTEGQAKDRAMAAGFSVTSELKKDADGIWRGMGMDGSKAVNIAVDYKGNVVVN